ncbi:MAG: beta-lactamase family protein [Planctomycetes bacterium]|nr:beta-lactamase family protein [Planctomycetota bacterium]
MNRPSPAVVLVLAGLGLLAALGAGAPPKESDEPIVAGDVGKKLDAAVGEAGGADFWGSVLVAREGKVLLAKGYGFADYKDTPNTPRTLFELASASKQVTAAAILHLQQKKKLSVDATLDKVFKEVPKDKRKITIRQILTHMSGMSGMIGVPYASTIARGNYIEQMLAEPLSSEPGTKFEYCNAGYALLAAVVEEVSGENFEEYCEKNLFRPAKLADTGFIGDRDLIKTGRASTRRTDEPGSFTAADWHWGWGYRGMGGVVTTLFDLLRWDQALRGDKILGEKARKDLYTPALEGYACGWKVDRTSRGTRKAHHSGGVAGYGVNIARYLEEDVAIFVLSNDGGKAHAVTGALEELLFH